MTKEEFLSKTSLVHNGKYSYPSLPEMVKSHGKIAILCSEHGVFPQLVYHHLRGSGCPKCGSSFHKTQDEFLSEVRSLCGDKYGLNLVDYKTTHTAVKLRCKKHGIFSKTPSQILIDLRDKKELCNICRGIKVDSKEAFVEKARRIHGEKYDYSASIYNGSTTKLEIICPKHGSFFKTPDAHYSGQGCKRCSRVGISILESQWLDSFNNPNIKRNFHIRCGEKRFLVDGFDETTNTVYEFNGDYYHGNPKYFSGIELNKTIKQFHSQSYSKTLSKERTLREYGFKVVSIWESDFMASLGKKFYIKPKDDNRYFQSKILLKKRYERLDPLNCYDFILEMP